MEKTYSIVFSMSDLRILSAALHEMPYRVVKELLEGMAAQTAAQDAANLAKLPNAPKVTLADDVQ
jgi:hypothetical protein